MRRWLGLSAIAVCLAVVLGLGVSSAPDKSYPNVFTDNVTPICPAELVAPMAIAQLGPMILGVRPALLGYKGLGLVWVIPGQEAFAASYERSIRIVPCSESLPPPGA